jgi:polar amino acid transport system substrate-binding protein
MEQLIQNYKTGKLSVEDVPMPKVESGGVLIENAFSLISAGTERSSVELARKSLLGKAKSRPEDVKKVLRLAKKQGLLNAYKTAMSRLEMPSPLGYSSSGIVIELGQGVTDVKVGDSVACAGAGYASHAEVIFVPKNLCAVIPKDVPLDWAAFTTLGAIAMQGVRQADLRVGEHVAVIGLGLLGQLSVQILKASGCRVIGIDLDPDKIELAKKSGVDRAILKSENVVDLVKQFTGGNGVDAVIITAATSSNDPFLLAPDIVRDRAKVVLVGVAKLDFPREPYYRKELSLILARSYGPGRYDTKYEEEGIDYPIEYVRWTEKRNMESVLNLMAEKKLNIAPLISHRFEIDDAEKAYDLILGKTKEKFLGVLFEYDTLKEHETKIFISKSHSAPSALPSAINVGFIGPGNFAQTCLLPNIKGDKIYFVGVADAQGTIANMVAKKYGYKYCTSDYKKLLDDKTISTIFIATRHNLHAQLIIESIKAGKHVFCEKPLCLNKKELNQITKTYNALCSMPNAPLLFIGYNRRFAPLTVKAKQFMDDKVGPYIINYRINAGMLSKDHWLLDLKQGGGRIIGEVCHFIDLISYFTQSRLISVYAECLGGSKTVSNDNIIATLKYEDGSIGSISYFAVGDKDFPKERIEIFGDEKVCVINDFREAIFSSEGKQTKAKKSQDKGFRNEISAFFDAIKNGKPSPIPFEQIVETTLATFAINESINTGRAVVMPSITVGSKD